MHPAVIKRRKREREKQKKMKRNASVPTVNIAIYLYIQIYSLAHFNKFLISSINGTFSQRTHTGQ